ncbi:hypothetical protein ACFL1X_07500 [Candidatus Hydrogenedentota bacterium]
MEVRESAACGISEREFTIEMTETESVVFFKILEAAESGSKECDMDVLDDLLGQMEHVVGSILDE